MLSGDLIAGITVACCGTPGNSYAIVLVLPVLVTPSLICIDRLLLSAHTFISSFVGVLIYCVSMHDLFLHFLTTYIHTSQFFATSKDVSTRPLWQ